MKLVKKSTCLSSLLAFMTMSLPTSYANAAPTQPAAIADAKSQTMLPDLTDAPQLIVDVLVNPILANMQQSLQSMTLLSLHQANHREITLASLALKRANNSEVRSYAQMLIKDHKQANDRVLDVAKQDKVSFYNQASSAAALMMDDMERMIGQLALLSGLDFDSAYLNTMVALHIKTMTQLTGSRLMMAESATKSLVDDVLPQLMEHLLQAKNLQEKMAYESLLNQ